MAKCPAHDDRNPSLSIGEVAGKVLLHCHAGCAQRDVIEALRARGLWPDRSVRTAAVGKEAVRIQLVVTEKLVQAAIWLTRC
jgi:hypothetical protein